MSKVQWETSEMGFIGEQLLSQMSWGPQAPTHSHVEPACFLQQLQFSLWTLALLSKSVFVAPECVRRDL